MTKIVYNACYGGFGISDEATRLYLNLKGWKYTESKHNLLGTIFKVDGLDYFYPRNIDRADPILTQVVETLGKKADGRFTELAIEDLPKGTLYRINEYDGYESIETADSVNWNIA